MTRYTINIGDDFPLGGDEEPGRGDTTEHRHRRHRRYVLFLRVLFFLAVAAIVIAHPLQTLILVGVVLWVRRSPRFEDLRARARGAWREAPWTTGDWSKWQRGGCWNRHERRHAGEQRTQNETGYRGFV